MVYNLRLSQLVVYLHIHHYFCTNNIFVGLLKFIEMERQCTKIESQCKNYYLLCSGSIVFSYKKHMQVATVLFIFFFKEVKNTLSYEQGNERITVETESL